MKVYNTRIKKIEAELKSITNIDDVIRTIEQFVKMLETEELKYIADNGDELTDEELRKIIESHEIAPNLKRELLRLCKGDEEECKK